jgi:ferric-dicitrate binding protein FerR (iron transport regulator)
MLKRLTTPWTVRAILVAAVAVVFLHSLSAQSRPAATLVLMSGQVSILLDGHDTKPLFAKSAVYAQQRIVTGPDSYAKFLLPDGSYFEVFEKSQVEFHADYGWAHLLNVIIGHVKVFIDHSKGPNSNSVTTPTAVISVRGTIFDIVVEDDDGTTLVTVDDGLVQVRNLTAPGAEPLLAPGQSVRVFRGQRLIGQQIDKGGIIQKMLRAATDAVRVYAQQHPGGIPVGGVGGPGATGIPGAQGDKGKGGAAPPPPPPAPPSTAGH